MATFRLPSDQRARAESLVEPALRFLGNQDHPLSEALVRYHWANGSADDVIDTLADYQNEDGGFGRGLEVDISSPVSNPFAARLAMQVMATVPHTASERLQEPLQDWLIENQHEDGDWHFAPEVYQADLAPWFAGWEFPALNPACCVLGAANRLDLGTPDMLRRVATLFGRLASHEEARSDQFYAVLPYVEYVTNVDVPNQEVWVQSISEGIVATDAAGNYVDAQHFFDHAIGGRPILTERIPGDLLSRWADTLLAEPIDDGGWPTPYNPAWRPWATASALITLARLRDGD